MSPPTTDHPAFVPITDHTGLPRVLLIGDSISMGYTLPTRKLLAGIANVHRPATNCADTFTGLKYLDQWLGDMPWDVIHFNWGLHDLKYVNAEGNMVDVRQGKQQVSLDQYRENLETLVGRLQKSHAALIWATTTPVPPGAHGRIAGDEVKYNAVAVEIMNKRQVMVNDLHHFVTPLRSTIQLPHNVHFTDAGYDALAEHVVSCIKSRL
jgi:hypothetical protein